MTQLLERWLTWGLPYTHNAQVQLPLMEKECRRISKHRIIPSDAELRFIRYEYGINLEHPCSAIMFSLIDDQTYAWKALNYIIHIKKFLRPGMGIAHYKEMWYQINK